MVNTYEGLLALLTQNKIRFGSKQLPDTPSACGGVIHFPLTFQRVKLTIFVNLCIVWHEYFAHAGAGESC